MVAGDGNDFARIVAVRSEKAIGVTRLLVCAVYDIAQVEHERRIKPTPRGCVIADNLFANLFGFLSVADAAITESVKSNFANGFDFRDPSVAVGRVGPTLRPQPVAAWHRAARIVAGSP